MSPGHYSGRIGATVLAFAAIAAPAHANLVSWEDGRMVMLSYIPEMLDTGAYYTFDPQFAAGIRYLGLNETDGRTDDIGMVQGNYLVKRWNEAGAQENVYVTGGMGDASSQFGREGLAGTFGTEADYESRRFYGSVRAEDFRGPHFEHASYTARAGVAPYEASYEDPQPWLILQADQTTGIDNHVFFRPTLRVFWHNYLVEANVSTRGDLGAAFMVHF